MGNVRMLKLLVLLLAIACTSQTTTQTVAGCRFQDHADFRRGPLFKQGAELNVDVAEDDASRERGLMGVTDLGTNDGMAFTWTEPTDATFWMKDTLIPLSIAFWGSDGRIVDLQNMEPCRANPCPLYRSTATSVGAVEVNLGFFAAHGIHVGDAVRLTETSPSPR
jgi:uncharacterized membrane protein (UPF0127 family)